MSSASTGPYQSRFLNLLLEKSQQLSARLGQAARQVKTATIWTVQLLIYPLYAMFQTGRLVGKQLQQAASQKRLGLPASQQAPAPVAKVQSQPQSQPNQQPETASATVSESETDLPLPPLTDQPQDTPLTRLFHKLINWMETKTVAVKVNLFPESKLKHLPPTATTTQKLSQQLSQANMGIAASLKATQMPQTEDASGSKPLPKLTAGHLPQWQTMTDAVADKTRSLWEPVKNWYMWQGDYPLNLEDEDLTRDLWAEPSSPTLAKAASANQTAQTQTFVPASNPELAANPLPQRVQVGQKSETVIRSTIREWFGKASALVHIPTVNAPNQGNAPANLTCRTSASRDRETTSTLTQTETPSTGIDESKTGRDYIETKVVSVGYVKHPLQVVLEAIDWVMLRLEKIFFAVRDWLLAMRTALFSSN